MPLFLEVTPTAGAREAQNAAEQSAAVIAFWGDRDRRAWGSQNSVIDGKRRRLRCHPPAVHWVTEKRPVWTQQSVQVRSLKAVAFVQNTRDQPNKDKVQLERDVRSIATSCHPYVVFPGRIG